MVRNENRIYNQRGMACMSVYPESNKVITTVIDSTNRWWRMDIIELWRYRDLAKLFAGRSLVTMYKQSILGPLWFFIQPLLTALVFYVAFGLMMRISTGNMPYLLFYISGMVFWYLFTNVFTTTADCFRANSHIFGKIYFPRLIIPVSYIISATTLFVLNLLTLALFYVGYKFGGAQIHLQWWVLTLPLLVGEVCLTGLGFGLCVAAASVRYRDVKYLLPMVTQFWMFMTPLFYSSHTVNPRMRELLFLNPLSAPIEYFRFTISGMNPLSIFEVIPGVCITLLVLLIGLFWFNYVQRDFIDVV